MDLSWLYKGKEILIGVTGGIAAYKVPELVRLFVKSDAGVSVVSTDAGGEFASPLVLEALSGNPVYREVLDVTSEGAIPHIMLAERSDLFVISPATANVLARLANGFADDLLTCTALAYRGPLVIAPGMNSNMWVNPATQRNVEILKSRGVFFVGPEEGELACGVTGVGRMSSPEVIYEACAGSLVAEKKLAGRKVLVTAGSTREAWDPVRFLGNRSTGRMGYALARAGVAQGAQVTLISGVCDTADNPPWGADVVSVETAREMYEKVTAIWENYDIVIKAAAVADWRPAQLKPIKCKKNVMGETCSLELARNPDILETMGRLKAERALKRPLIVGFAAETGTPDVDVVEIAREKMNRKGCDVMVVNDVAREGSGFGVETNQVKILYRSGEMESFGLMSKDELAHEICIRAADGI